jgi:hypothetical protein
MNMKLSPEFRVYIESIRTGEIISEPEFNALSHREREWIDDCIEKISSIIEVREEFLGVKCMTYTQLNAALFIELLEEYDPT